LCQHIDGLLRGFWWSDDEGKRRTYWVAWDTMVQPIYLGGLGFKDLEMFYVALLEKQSRRILVDRSSLSARIFF
jgi:hypothetical protein